MAPLYCVQAEHVVGGTVWTFETFGAALAHLGTMQSVAVLVRTAPDGTERVLRRHVPVAQEKFAAGPIWAWTSHAMH